MEPLDRIETTDEDGWPQSTSRRQPRKQYQSRNSFSKNRCRQNSRQNSCRSSFNSSRKLRRDKLIKKQKNIYKKATSYLPPARASSSTSVVIDSKYKAPTRRDASHRRTAQFKNASRRNTRRNTGRLFGSRGNARSRASSSTSVIIDSQYKSPTRRDDQTTVVEFEDASRGNTRRNTGLSPRVIDNLSPLRAGNGGSAGQNIMNQFVGDLLLGPLNVNSPNVRELAYALVDYYEHEDQNVITLESEFGSPRPLAVGDANDSLLLINDRNGNDPEFDQLQRSPIAPRTFGTFLPPGPSVNPTWRNNIGAGENNVQPPPRSVINGTRPRAYGSLLGRSPRPQNGSYQYSPNRSRRDLF